MSALPLIESATVRLDADLGDDKGVEVTVTTDDSAAVEEIAALVATDLDAE